MKSSKEIAQELFQSILERDSDYASADEAAMDMIEECATLVKEHGLSKEVLGEFALLVVEY